MLVTFYGVRGSIPAPGESTIKYGGNTSCVHVRLNTGQNLVFDAGTGIRRLGMQLARHQEPVLLLLSHGHWDHIQGYPFFDPIYQKHREIVVCQGSDGNASSLRALLEQMDGSNFPVHADNLPANIRTIQEVQQYLDNQLFVTKRMDLNHPGGGHAYRVEEDGVSLAYITDNELSPPTDPQTKYAEWVEYCRDVDLLIHDAQYDENDMPAKHGWGHSLISQVRQLALDANVKNLVLYHHDPERTDSQLDEITLANQAFYKSKGANLCAYTAAEGMCFDLSRKKDPKVNNATLM